jgi:hypothetical protein
MTVGDPSYWDDFFQQNLIPAVLGHVIATWEKMPKPGPSDLEDAISNKLYSALVKSKDRRSLADEYVKEGMQRFVDGKYARFVRHGAMLAYVLDGDTDRAIRNVENNIRSRLTELRMKMNSGFIASTIRPDDPRTKETRHHRAHETTVFRIHHLFAAEESQGQAAGSSMTTRN